MDSRFYDRTTRKPHPAIAGHKPVVDPRFYKKKALRFVQASVVSRLGAEGKSSVITEDPIVCIESKKLEIEPNLDDIEMKEALQELEEFGESGIE